jgi:ABC-type molybdate transport system substrate-binding protein
VQASAETAAVGKLTLDTLSVSGLSGPLDRVTDVVRTSVTEVANDLVIGSADAGLIYDAMSVTYPQLHIVRLPELDSAIATVSIGLLRGSRQRERAMDFVDFLTAADGGLAVYREFGFEVAP